MNMKEDKEKRNIDSRDKTKMDQASKQMKANRGRIGQF